MKRDLLSALDSWRVHPLRKPLILHGARQVGKSWLVQHFGQRFDNFVEINLEKKPEAHAFFAGDLEVSSIISKLELYTQQKIIPGKTLLFLDEIQECEQAIKALRYFKEDFPELHVIAAGSLINFVLEKIGLPVGRVQFYYVHPLSFGEFLTVSGRQDLRDYIKIGNIEPVFHQQLFEFLKTYFWLGGMPAVVDAWIKHQDAQFCLETQDEIITTYKQDFVKYARRYQVEKVEKVFNAIPEQLGNKFKYVTVDPELRSLVLKNALELLSKAGIAHIIRHSSAQGQPLAATANHQHFKVFFFDIGLAQRMLGLDLKTWVLEKIAINHLGSICEQFVAQEYIAYTAIKSPPELFYWHREARNSNAEIDFLFIKHNKIIPVEVKSGVKGHLKSLHLFLESHPHSLYGLKISEGLFENVGRIMSIPFYAIESWLVREID